jgi:hypothetical protein
VAWLRREKIVPKVASQRQRGGAMSEALLMIDRATSINQESKEDFERG